MELTAATTLNPTDIFSLLPLLGNSPAASKASSVPPAQAFSSLLTEMTGTNPNPAATPVTNQTQIAAVSQTQPSQETQQVPSAPPPLRIVTVQVQQIQTMPQVAAPQIQLQTTQPQQAQPQPQPAQPGQTAAGANSLPEAGQPAEPAPVSAANTNIQPKSKGSRKSPAPSTTPGVNVMVASMACVSSAVSSSAQVSASPSTAVDDKKIKADDASAQAIAEAMNQVPQPELERAFADVKKFEFTVQPGAAPQAPAALPENDATAPLADALKAAVVATDPIVTVQQQQLPLRIVEVQPVTAEAKPSDRSKSNSTSSSDSTVSTWTSQPADLVRPVESADQAPAPNPIEIPDMPHLPVIRTIAMEVGDPGSQVMIHIRENGGDVAMQLNTGSAPLHQDLQSSVGSLVQSLKQEQVQVSNIEVTRKSPIDKVRRMKEAQ